MDRDQIRPATADAQLRTLPSIALKGKSERSNSDPAKGRAGAAPAHVSRQYSQLSLHCTARCICPRSFVFFSGDSCPDEAFAALPHHQRP